MKAPLVRHGMHYGLEAQKRTAMAEALGVPCTGHSYEDAWLSLVAHEGGREVAQTFEVKQLAPILDLDTKGLCNLLRRFHAFDLNGSGTLNFEEFMVRQRPRAQRKPSRAGGPLVRGIALKSAPLPSGRSTRRRRRRSLGLPRRRSRAPLLSCSMRAWRRRRVPREARQAS